MNISINNIPRLYNRNILSYSTQDSRQSQYNLNYNRGLTTDTVSFSSRKEDTAKKNSKILYDKIASNNYDSAYMFVSKLAKEGLKWDPNYVNVDPQTKKLTPLVSLTLRKMATTKHYHDCEVIMDIIDYIIWHKNYVSVNPITDEDYVKTAINTLKKRTLSDVIHSNLLFARDIDAKKYDEYIKYAEERNREDIASQLRVLKKINFSDDENINEKQTTVTDDTKLKEVQKLRKNLAKYQVIPLENDPKNLDEVGGMFKAKDEIREFIIKPWDKSFRDRIIENKLNRPSGFLLSGPPGCGKSYIMKAIAAETGYNLYEINLSNMGASLAYKMQQDLKELFDSLEELYKLTGEPSIIILDELDSIAMNRQKANSDWKKDDVNALLMVLNNSSQRGIIVVGATNNPDDLDEAARRPGRLDRQIIIDKPNNEERRDIITKIMYNKPIAEEILKDIDSMVSMTKNMSPAAISAIINYACLHAIYNKKEFVTIEDFKLASDKIRSNAEILKGHKTVIGYRSELN